MLVQQLRRRDGRPVRSWVRQRVGLGNSTHAVVDGRCNRLAQAKAAPATPGEQLLQRGERPAVRTAPATAKTRLAAPSKKNELPPPVELKGNDLLTRDGVMLKGTFYPGTKERHRSGRSSALLKGDRRSTWPRPDAATTRLCRSVPDLRGFGDSTQVVVGARFAVSNTRLKPVIIRQWSPTIWRPSRVSIAAE